MPTKAISAFIIIFLAYILFPAKVFAVNNLDLSLNYTFNLRIDGAVAGDSLGRYILNISDINNNGKNDVIVGSPNTAFNGTNSGSIYIIYDDILDDYQGDGNSLDLSDDTSYSVRIDGPEAGSYLGYDSSFDVEDLTGDGKPDIVVSAPYVGFNSRPSSGSVYIISNDIITSFTYPSHEFDLSDENNYTIRYDGAASGDGLGDGSVTTGDLDADGKMDLLISAWETDNNGRSRAGSVYLIYGSLIQSINGDGNEVDLLQSGSFNIRYDGASVDDVLGFAGTRVGDVTGDGKPDILIPSFASHNGTQSGSIWVISNTLVDDYSAEDNTVDLFTNTNYTTRIDGAAAGDLFGLISVGIADLDGNGKNELVSASPFADNNGRADSGSIYVFSDTLLASKLSTNKVLDLSNTQNFTTRIDAPAASETLGLWTDLADITGDGKADLLAAAYRADYLDRADSGSVYVFNNPLLTDYTPGRIVDMNHPYFSKRYDGEEAGVLLGSGGLFVGDANNDNIPDLLLASRFSDHNNKDNSGSVYLIYGKNYPDSPSAPVIRYQPDIWANTYGASAKYEIIGIADWGSIPWDSDFNVDKMLSQSDHLGGYKRLSHIYNIWFTSWFNNARILEPTKPYIIALRYTEAMLGSVNPNNVKLIFSNDEGKIWKVVQNTVIDNANSTAAVTSTQGGYYALVEVTY